MFDNFLTEVRKRLIVTILTTVLIGTSPTILTIGLDLILDTFHPNVTEPISHLIDRKQLFGMFLRDRPDRSTGTTRKVVIMLKDGINEPILITPTTDQFGTFVSHGGTLLFVKKVKIERVGRTDIIVKEVKIGQVALTDTIGTIGIVATDRTFVQIGKKVIHRTILTIGIIGTPP
jgi:hypothetical protein